MYSWFGCFWTGQKRILASVCLKSLPQFLKVKKVGLILLRWTYSKHLRKFIWHWPWSASLSCEEWPVLFHNKVQETLKTWSSDSRKNSMADGAVPKSFKDI